MNEDIHRIKNEILDSFDEELEQQLDEDRLDDLVAGADVEQGGVPEAGGVAPAWAKGFDGQRKADLGDGRFLNPIMAGDHPDPSILKDGDDYYMTFSSFESVPGIHIWHSRDLVNWQPVVAALTTNIGSVWAPELIKHEGKFYCYIPARFPDYRSNYVIWADRIEGPWSEPIDLKIPANIDPGHVVGEDGKRYLFLNGGDRVKLTDDGLATDGALEHAYSPWRYPDDWDVEGFSPEGPKITRHGDYFYLITAVGWAPAYQLSAGLRASVTENVAVFGEYKFQNTFGYVDTGTYSYSMPTHSLLAGLRFSTE